MEASIAMTILGLTAGIAVVLAFWLGVQVQKASAARVAALAQVLTLSQRVDLLNQSVQDRDRALTDKTAELARTEAALAATEAHRAEAVELAGRLAATDPAAVTDAIRDQLGRLRSLPQLPSVPGAAPPASRPPG